MHPKALITTGLLIFLFVLLKMKPANGQSSSSSSQEQEQLEEDVANEIPLRLTPGSCKTSGLCCPGRDSSCVVQKALPNAIIEDLDDIPCYCDHACLNIGDCCPDFKSACGVFDCQVSNWGPWSECDVLCGSGVMTRNRKIIQEPRNGGKLCPSLVQKRACVGTECQQNIRSSLEETAIILPASYSLKRRVNEGRDITRNLRLRYMKYSGREIPKPYCVEFEVIRSTKACKGMERFHNLREGNRVCTLCEPDAQRPYADYKCVGTGTRVTTNEFSTRFSSLQDPSCRGKWRHIFSNSTCSCRNGADFIFI